MPRHVWFSALECQTTYLIHHHLLYNVFFHLFDIEGCVDDIPLSLLIHSFCQPLRLFTHQPFFYHNFYEERPKSEQRRRSEITSSFFYFYGGFSRYTPWEFSMFSYSSASILYLHSLFSLLYLNQSYTIHMYI